ncbi:MULTISPECIES: 2Fe-2S iron-sulfur cluster-binding protein [Pseudonocardia]|uniref:Phenol hydroxylase P5 protein n=2 Tax=Pseudonocardia TaxID=1847 RepID=A0A1Y2MSZ8_PSEAH|nr:MULTISPECIES: 2Fe-2S iron-sulfur cluster-binding protein [Pseudonocardia]OSY38336.1 Phenol hydroxylase P5 protein [Pseudonocardia autotrophica]TDN72619.1 CDP-4-dehydro-6-deoxyglucose reductase/3-phenylpropionate/trans-cinnamate dioxygenase ferredoxin reductase subunit/phenol hydroxylase P5 protein [Pseudonocardia autotrophica]BBG03328.1 phenol hydroxylase P5 protein [Pseudonocardia autotrophica]GEC24586.1 phenol hydroxylase P5 protein [Pseudonocardia saturnea]
MVFTATVGGKQVPCHPDQAILDAFLRGGVWMPNSCNQGTCGTCKVRVLRGEVDHRDSPADTLAPDERAAGLALACQARLRSDAVVEPSGPGAGTAGRDTHPLRDLDTTVVDIEDIARDTRRVRLGLTDPLAFHPGQYVELAVPGSGVRRQYSLANTADEDKVLELHVRLVEGGAATERWIFDGLAVGDRVRAAGPLGDFFLAPADEDGGEPMVMIGGGTGLAPLIALARTALTRDPGRQILLYHGVRGAADLYDLDLMARLGETHPGFTFVPVLSHEDPPPGTAHRTGLPTDLFVDDVASARGWSGWLCGPPPMVEAGVKAFKRRRMAPRLIHREKFTPADA